MNPAIFLDRDGVLNQTQVINGKPYAPSTLEDFQLLPGTKDALSALKKLGYLLIVVTNQPDVGNGKTEKSVVEAMHAELLKSLPIDNIQVCYHSQTENCACRKPKTGMFHSAAELYEIDLKRSFMIGDRRSDIEAGTNAGCKTIFIDNNYAEPKPERPDYIIHSLVEVLDIIKVIGIV